MKTSSKSTQTKLTRKFKTKLKELEEPDEVKEFSDNENAVFTQISAITDLAELKVFGNIKQFITGGFSDEALLKFDELISSRETELQPTQQTTEEQVEKAKEDLEKIQAEQTQEVLTEVTSAKSLKDLQVLANKHSTTFKIFENKTQLDTKKESLLSKMLLNTENTKFSKLPLADHLKVSSEKIDELQKLIDGNFLSEKDKSRCETNQRFIGATMNLIGYNDVSLDDFILNVAANLPILTRKVGDTHTGFNLLSYFCAQALELTKEQEKNESIDSKTYAVNKLKNMVEAGIEVADKRGNANYLNFKGLTDEFAPDGVSWIMDYNSIIDVSNYEELQKPKEEKNSLQSIDWNHITGSAITSKIVARDKNGDISEAIINTTDQKTSEMFEVIHKKGIEKVFYYTKHNDGQATILAVPFSIILNGFFITYNTYKMMHDYKYEGYENYKWGWFAYGSLKHNKLTVETRARAALGTGGTNRGEKDGVFRGFLKLAYAGGFKGFDLVASETGQNAFRISLASQVLTTGYNSVSILGSTVIDNLAYTYERIYNVYDGKIKGLYDLDNRATKLLFSKEYNTVANPREIFTQLSNDTSAIFGDQNLEFAKAVLSLGTNRQHQRLYISLVNLTEEFAMPPERGVVRNPVSNLHREIAQRLIMHVFQTIDNFSKFVTPKGVVYAD